MNIRGFIEDFLSKRGVLSYHNYESLDILGLVYKNSINGANIESEDMKTLDSIISIHKILNRSLNEFRERKLAEGNMYFENFEQFENIVLEHLLNIKHFIEKNRKNIHLQIKLNDSFNQYKNRVDKVIMIAKTEIEKNKIINNLNDTSIR